MDTLDANAFNEVVSTTRLSTASREAARLVFVEGMKAVDAGEQCGLSKVRMSQVVKTVREAQARLEASRTHRTGSELVAAVEASYAHVVKEARSQLGDDVSIASASPITRNTGPVIARSDFHMAQAVGKDKVVIHDLAKLDKAPAVGRNVAIEYRQGRGEVVDRSQERSRGGRSL